MLFRRTLISRLAPALVVALVVAMSAGVAQACPVCFGEKEAPVTQGLISGVVFMVGITYLLLSSFLGFAAFCVVRNRRRMRTSTAADAAAHIAPAGVSAERP